MLYQVMGEDGQPLDAHFELSGSAITFLSRGGAKSGGATRNADYGLGLRLLLNRISQGKQMIAGAWVDSTMVQHLPLSAREVLASSEGSLPPVDTFTLLSSRMKKVGNPEGTGGNSTKKLRINLKSSLPEAELANLLGGMIVQKDVRSLDRIPATILAKVSPEHVWMAVQRLLVGTTDDDFGPSTDFDLIAENGIRLPPKAVFGIAASDALGFQVLPKHFTGGEGSPCFRILRDSGYVIVAKDVITAIDDLAAAPDDITWAEGKSKLVSHLKKERAPGLAKAKKAEFKRVHGKLFCERCSKDPVEEYGADVGEACIEVHHKAIHVKDMQDGHTTVLADLQCLCANCHRIVHAELKKLNITEGALINTAVRGEASVRINNEVESQTLRTID